MKHSSRLTEDFLTHFNIAEIIEQKPRSGQKQVYIVKVGHDIFALKIIHNNDERIIRELKIYEEFKDVDGIPLVKKIEKYNHELVLFEEYIEGKDLSKIAREYIGDSPKVRKLLHDIATILTPVWERNYVHRDLKPQNIIIKNNGSPVVLDFGIARDLEDESITPTGFQPFTWAFGSPEQLLFKKNQISYRTDFFCLGIIAHFLYTGELPFGKNRTEVANRFVKNREQKIDIGDGDLNIFLNASLKYTVAQRPRTIETFINNLKI